MNLEQLLAMAPHDTGQRRFGPTLTPDEEALLVALMLENEPVAIVGDQAWAWVIEHAPTEQVCRAAERAYRAHGAADAGGGAAETLQPQRECPGTLRAALAELAERPVGLTSYEAQFAGDVSRRDEQTWTPRQRRFAEKLVRRVMA